MDEQPGRVGEGMPHVDGIRTRNVVLQVEQRQLMPAVAQELREVFVQIPGGLEDDDVEGMVPYPISRNLMKVGWQVKRCAAAAIALGTARFDGQIPIVLDAGERIEI